MANPERGEALLEVNGEGYILKITIGSAIELQARKGKPLGALFDAVPMLDMDAIAGLLWACLQAHHPRQFKTEAQVVALMDQAGGLSALNTFIDAITAVVNLNKPSTNGASAAEGNPPMDLAGGTSESSTSTPDPSA